MNVNLIELENKGYTIIPSFFDKIYMNAVSESMDYSYELCREIQIKNGIDAVTDGTVHHLLATDDSIYLEILQKISLSPLYEFIKTYFKGNCVLNSYGGVINITSKPSYVANIHRDIRFFSGDFPLMLNMLIMLDDFTLENGATYLFAKSHLKEDKPSNEEFYEKSDRAVGKKGDILFFNSNLWHAAGINTTNQKRRAITITFTKPFMKQQLDYSRVIGYENVEKLSIELQQLVGFYSRIPSNLEEWYQKPEQRFYRPGQD
ncbi:phytanoyl-CoA dioxygenase family protein [Flavobacterium sp. LB3P21]|uniref:phytanoyl-CoA dioxygenase family protein n=1 Tax=unclassified Flavobacterium TaxID=196869 RepID=UPI003AB01208